MGGDQNSLKGFWSNLAWERLRILQEELESAAGKKDVWTTPPQPDQEEQRTGWWTFSPTLTSFNFNSFKQHFESYKLHVDLEVCSWMKLRVLTRQQVGSEQATEPTGSPQNEHHISTQSDNTPLHLKPAAAPEQTEVCSSLWTRRHNSTDDAAASVWTSGFILTLRFSDEAASDLVISVTGRWTSLSLSPGCEWTRGCSEFFTESCCSFNAGFVQSRWSKSVGRFNWNHLLIKCRHFLLTTDTQTCFHRTWRGNWYFSF